MHVKFKATGFAGFELYPGGQTHVVQFPICEAVGQSVHSIVIVLKYCFSPHFKFKLNGEVQEMERRSRRKMVILNFIIIIGLRG